MPWQYQTVPSNSGQSNVNGQVVNVPNVTSQEGWCCSTAGEATAQSDSEDKPIDQKLSLSHIQRR